MLTFSERKFLSKLDKAVKKGDYDFFENVFNKYGSEVLDFLLKNVSDDFILKNEKNCTNYSLMIEMALKTGVFDSYVLSKICDNNQFHLISSFYDENPELVFNYLEHKRITRDLYENVSALLDTDQKRSLLKKLSSDLSEISKNIKYFSDLPSDEREYLALLILENNDVTSEMLYKLLYFKMTTLKQTDKAVMLLSNMSDAKFIYRTLMDVALTEDNKVLLEKRLKATKSLEYNFYYEFYKRIDDFLILFGSFMALKMFLENSLLFKDKMEFLKLKNLINDKAKDEINNFKSLASGLVFSDAGEANKGLALKNKVS